MPASAAMHQARSRALLQATLLLALLTIANAAFHDPSVTDDAYDKDDASMCLTDAGLHAINQATSNVTQPGHADLVVAAAKLYMWGKPILAWLQTLEQAKNLTSANGTTATGAPLAALLPNTFIHSRANKYFWSDVLPSLGHVPSLVSLDLSSGPVTIRLPSNIAAYTMSVLDSEFNVLASFTSHDLHQFKKASNGSFVFAVLAPGQALKDKTNTTVIRSPTLMGMVMVRTILLQHSLDITGADPTQDAMSAAGAAGPLSGALLGPQVSAAVRASSLGRVDLLSNATAKQSFNLFLAIQLAARAGFFDARKAPFTSAATVLSSVLPALGFHAGANTTQANLTSNQLAILNKGAHIGHDCIVKASQGLWTETTQTVWFSFVDPNTASVAAAAAGADPAVLASLVPAVRFYRWFWDSEDADGLQSTYWAVEDATGLPLSNANAYAFTSPPATPGLGRFLSVYDPIEGAAMLSPDSAPVFIPRPARPGARNLTNVVRVGALAVVRRQLAAEGAPFVYRNFLSLNPRDDLAAVTSFKLVFREVALRRSALGGGGRRRRLQAADSGPGSIAPIGGASTSDLLGYIQAAANNNLIGAGYNVIIGIPLLGACPVSASWTGDPGLTRQPVLAIQPGQIIFDAQSSCAGSYATGYQTSATSYQSSSYNSVSLSAGYSGVSASSSNSWSSSMNSTYSNNNAYTTLTSNCIVGHATYNSGLVSTASNAALLSPNFVDAVAAILAEQVINDFVPPENPTTTCLASYFSSEISDLFEPGYNDCWDCRRDQSRCTLTCSCRRADQNPQGDNVLLLNNCLGGKIFNVDGDLQCVAGFPTVGGCTYMATSRGGGGFPAGTYLRSIDAAQSCTFTTTKSKCVLDCSRFRDSAVLDVQKCAVNYNNIPWTEHVELSFENDYDHLKCAALPGSSDPASCPAFPGYAFYQKFTGGSSSTKDPRYVGQGLSLGQLASYCNAQPVCVGFDTFGNLWLYLTYNQFNGAWGAFSPVEYTSNCGGIYISLNYASTRTLNSALYKGIFNIYGTHYIKSASFGSALTQCVTTSSATQSAMASSSFDTANKVGIDVAGASVSGGFEIGSSDGSSSSSATSSYSSNHVYSPGNLNLRPIFPNGNLVIDNAAFAEQTAAAVAAAGQVQPVTMMTDSLSSLITLPGPAAQILDVANKLASKPAGGFTINNLNQLASLMDASMQFKYDDSKLGCQVGGGFPCFPV